LLQPKQASAKQSLDITLERRQRVVRRCRHGSTRICRFHIKQI
jgi:hypothetical protein